MTITHDMTIGQIAAENPIATRIFARHRIDYCCGGGKPLREACQKRGVDVDTVLEEIREVLDSSNASEESWDQAPLADLIEHILYAYHRPLKEELPRLEAMAAKVLRVHGDMQPDVLPELHRVVAGLKQELEEHMAKEEQILFPMIRRGEGFMADGPIHVMELEHDSVAVALRRLRELTNDYTAPEGACTTWRAMWHGLAMLEEEMHRHIHLENNILFPRALMSH